MSTMREWALRLCPSNLFRSVERKDRHYEV